MNFNSLIPFLISLILEEVMKLIRPALKALFWRALLLSGIFVALIGPVFYYSFSSILNISKLIVAALLLIWTNIKFSTEIYDLVVIIHDKNRHESVKELLSLIASFLAMAAVPSIIAIPILQPFISKYKTLSGLLVYTSPDEKVSIFWVLFLYFIFLLISTYISMVTASKQLQCDHPEYVNTNNR